MLGSTKGIDSQALANNLRWGNLLVAFRLLGIFDKNKALD